MLDNASTHKTPAVKRWLTNHPRFVLHFTPTSSSWLNLVERWFAELTTKKLRRGTHTSVRQLNTDIRAWIDTWNDNPRPYVWTKTADQILDSASATTANELTTQDTRTRSSPKQPRPSSPLPTRPRPASLASIPGPDPLLGGRGRCRSNQAGDPFVAGLGEDA